MSAASGSMDATSKRWLAALVLAILASAVILTRSFLNALSPAQEKDATALESTDTIREVRTISQPPWSQPQRSQPVQRQPKASAAPSDNSESAMRKKKAAAEQMIHHQAENLRALVKEDKVPEAYGNLTMEKIDEMEKKGEMIW